MRHRLGLFVAVLVSVAVALPSAAFAGIEIHKIRYDPPGPDYRTASQLRAEYIVVKNTTSTGKQLRGRVIRDRAGHRYVFPRYWLYAGGYVKVHTGTGRDRRGDLYWDSGNFIWNNDGDRAWVKTRGGVTTDTCAYAGGPSPNPPKYC
jgi:hypothetical protein